MTPSLLDRHVDAVLRRRWLVVALATLLMLAVTAGARFIGVTNDYRSMFAADNPQLAALDALEDTYSASNLALIAVAPREGSVFTREVLGAVEALTEAAWRTPWSIRVDSLTNYLHSSSVEDDLAVEPLVEDAGSLGDDDLKRIEGIALNAPDLAGRLVAHDGRVAGLAISFALPENPDAAVVEITDHLDGLLDEARASHPGIAYHLTRRRGHEPGLHRRHAGRPADADAHRVPRHRGRGRRPAALRARHPGPRRCAHVRHQHHHGVRRLDRHGVQPGQFRRGDHRDDGRGRAFGPCRHGRPRRHAPRPRPQRGGGRIAARQRLADVPHQRHDGDRLPEPERLGFAAVPRPRQSRGLRRAVRLRLLGDATAGAAVHPAAAHPPGRDRTPGPVRPPRRLRGRAAHHPALVRHRCRRRPRHGYSPHRADRQLDAVLRRALPVPERHRFRHREPDRHGDAGVFAEAREAKAASPSPTTSARSTPSPNGTGGSRRSPMSRRSRTS